MELGLERKQCVLVSDRYLPLTRNSYILELNKMLSSQISSNAFTLYVFCSVVECELVTPENGNAETGLGCIIQYSCNLGYKLVGHAQPECLENRIWSEGQVRCEHRCCCMV